MQKLVERRESYLDAEIRARDEMRKEARRVQSLVRRATVDFMPRFK